VLAFCCLAVVRRGAAVVLTRSILLYVFDTPSLWLDVEVKPETDEAIPASTAACAAHAPVGAEPRTNINKEPNSSSVLRIVVFLLRGQR